MIFPNQPVLTLISNGCECLLLHKASFIEIASDQYKQNLRRSEIPFPTDVAFYREYHDSEIWKRFTKKTYIDAFQRVHLESFQDQRRSPMKADQNHRRSMMITPVWKASEREKKIVFVCRFLFVYFMHNTKWLPGKILESSITSSHDWTAMRCRTATSRYA